MEIKIPEFDLSNAFITSGFIILSLLLFFNTIEILWSSLIFFLLGTFGFAYIFYSKNIYYGLIACILIILVISTNIYILAVNEKKIKSGNVSNYYNSLFNSNMVLLFIELILISRFVKTNFTFKNLSFIFFLTSLNLIILITEGIILKYYSTDG
jgi:hypothetical protein